MKAQFHKHQKVWVEAVGAWAAVERIVPTWAKGFDEPVKIAYDVGLGRDFAAHELRAAEVEELKDHQLGDEWRLMRARNKWQTEDDCAHHPYPGSFPVVVTDAADWGGWRVPGAEYDRDPAKIEYQSRLIARAPKMLLVLKDLAAFVGEHTEEAPQEILRLGRAADAIIRSLAEVPAALGAKSDGEAEEAA
ncbi:MAG: hypothetical protein ABIO37_02900 [Caulobacteraceae bacterium]